MQDFAKVDHKPTQSDGWAKKLQRTELDRLIERKHFGWAWWKVSKCIEIKNGWGEIGFKEMQSRFCIVPAYLPSSSLRNWHFIRFAGEAAQIIIAPSADQNLFWPRFPQISPFQANTRLNSFFHNPLILKTSLRQHSNLSKVNCGMRLFEEEVHPHKTGETLHIAVLQILTLRELP